MNEHLIQMDYGDENVALRSKTDSSKRAKSAYMTLLSSLATDLELMLNDLRTTPHRFMQSRSSDPIISSSFRPEDRLSQHFLKRNVPFQALESEDGNASVDDELQALLPKQRELSKDDLSQSHPSLASSSDGGILAEGETSSDTSSSSSSPLCDLGLVERLLRTHPVWFLPGIQRAGAVHLLQGKEEGNFVVRGSSQTNTMAVSVRLPPDTGPYIEHYLIQSNDGQLNLESSRFKFDSIPALIAHYAQCCDELPVQLRLPRALREALNRQQLSSLALLGQEFWRYPMAAPRLLTSSATTLSTTSVSVLSSSVTMNTESSGIGTTTNSNKQNISKLASTSNLTATTLFSPSIKKPISFFSHTGTPSDTTSSISSFASTLNDGAISHQIQSPESIDDVGQIMSPLESQHIGIVGKTSTFKTQSRKSLDVDHLSSYFNNIGETNLSELIDRNIHSTVRPTPPNTLNLGIVRNPPAPPPRWSKSMTPSSSTSPTDSQVSNNFTVTTTVTFSLASHQNSQLLEMSSPNSNTTFTTMKRLSPEGECTKIVDSMQSSKSAKQWHSLSRNSSKHNRQIIPSNSVETLNSQTSPNYVSKKMKIKKESKHYQESDILESPQIYCRSTLGDKISDYEDLWSQDNQFSTPVNRGQFMSSFRPLQNNSKQPDIIADTTSSVTPPNSTSDIETVGLSSSREEESNQSSKQLMQPRNRLGLVLPMSDTSPCTTDETIIERRTDFGNKCGPDPVKQGSPFYAEPADALGNVIIRRPLRSNLFPNNHRHSEPPNGVVQSHGHFNQILSPIESETSPVSGSLDELKKKPRNMLGRLDPWPLDSSWEFMCNDNEESCVYDAEWTATKKNLNDVAKFKIQAANKSSDPRTLTVHDIIAKRHPELNITELIKLPSNIPKFQEVERQSVGNSDRSADKTNSKTICNKNRVSSYDNIEKRNSNYASSALCSAHSDDGTIFSEPWDSSQWDSFLPNDDTSDTIHFSKCKSAICNSEDDTIVDESTTYRTFSDAQYKVATIFRNRSGRDREILRHPRNRVNAGSPGDSVGSYALTLARDPTTTFSRNIDNFISCTKESREVAPQIVMRNMRQFMSGMKNYLVKHGEGDFQREVLKARAMLKPDEFLNLDTILETVMHQLVVLPLREHLYGLFVDYYTSTGDIQLLVDNVKYASSRNVSDFGIRPSVLPPSSASMYQISLLLLRLQETELPLEKLELLLTVISTIFETTTYPKGQILGADDFLPLLVYIVAKCGFIGAEIEAEFMWCLLQQSLLSGEAGYYLTALCSAVHVLKSFKSSENECNKSLDFQNSMAPASSSVLRVIIPDEFNGSLQTRTLPVRPHTTTRDVCRIIAHKARITNPQDYGLFKLVDGEETLLLDSDCPQDVRLAARGKHCILAYKRIEAKIAWPTSSQALFHL